MRKYLLALALSMSFAIAMPANATQVDYSNRDLECMSKNLYFEAGGEGERGMIMVAEVTLNRLENGKFPETICGVVYQKGAFNWTRGSEKIKDKEQFAEAREIAKKVLDGKARLTGTEALFFKRSGTKSSFHATRKYLGTSGNHDFYR